MGGGAWNPRSSRGSAQWPATPWDAIRLARDGAGEERTAARNEVLRLYYRPVFRFFQRVLRIADDRVEDVTQDFFVRLIESDVARKITHETSFRGFLKVAARRHRLKWLESEGARRREVEAVAAKAAARAADLAAEVAEDPALEGIFDEECRRVYLEDALHEVEETLKRRGRESVFAILLARLGGPEGGPPESYESLAARFGRRVYDVRNDLAAARKLFRRALLRLAGERAENPRDELAELGLLRFVA